jgi:hypothetical protein
MGLVDGIAELLDDVDHAVHGAGHAHGQSDHALGLDPAGLIFGRSVWRRAHDESLRFVARLQDILATLNP